MFERAESPYPDYPYGSTNPKEFSCAHLTNEIELDSYPFWVLCLSIVCRRFELTLLARTVNSAFWNTALRHPQTVWFGPRDGNPRSPNLTSYIKSTIGLNDIEFIYGPSK